MPLPAIVLRPVEPLIDSQQHCEEQQGIVMHKRIWSQTLVCVQSISAVSALSQLVSSVSHNALATALPGQPATSQQQFNGKFTDPGIQADRC